MAKVMISIPDDDLARIDHEAARRGTSRIRRGQQLLAGIEPVDTTAMIRATITGRHARTHDRGALRRERRREVVPRRAWR
jgi:hypothetical protein